ncbi:MAG TPA: hypothetical protein VMI32_13750 [Candidatus Solibacter sp.]|nr:hypothetical protein [Candidatus Solibacter sp.]
MGDATGPRTPRGKLRSSRNAAKHWIESRTILSDEQAEAATLRSGFEEDFKPEGLIEHEIIDDLVMNRLHKRRIDVAMTREFAKATIEKTNELLENKERPAARYWLRLAGLVGRHSLEVEPARPDICIYALESLIKRIADRGPDPQDLELLRIVYGSRPTERAARTMHMLADAETMHSEKGDLAAPTRQKLQESILATLRTEVGEQREREELASELVAIECASDLTEPAPNKLETLQRYRTANMREFTHLMDSLERVRRLRRNAD